MFLEQTPIEKSFFRPQVIDFKVWVILSVLYKETYFFTAKINQVSFLHLNSNKLPELMVIERVVEAEAVREGKEKAMNRCSVCRGKER